MAHLLKIARLLPKAEDLGRFHKCYRRIVEAGYAQNPVTESSAGPKRRGRRKHSKTRNLLDRFRDLPDGILAFMHDFSVPFDNNISERDQRMMKLSRRSPAPLPRVMPSIWTKYRFAKILLVL
jgi:hypothetical protein